MPLIKIKNKELDVSYPLNKTDFDLIREDLVDESIPTILEVAHILRMDFEQSKNLLDLASSLCETSKKESILILVIGLMLQHKLDVRSLLDELQENRDKRVQYLKGLFFMNNEQYEDAEFCFESADYKKGIEMCQVLKNNTECVMQSRNAVIRCYASSTNYDSVDSQAANQIDNKDFLFIIGKSDKFENFCNFDVKLALLVNQLNAILNESNSESRDVNALNDILNKFIELTYRSSAYLFYLIGKIYHILIKYDQAKEWYGKALSLDPNYPPALFNLCRLSDEIYDGPVWNTDISDSNALVSLKNDNFDIDPSKCSLFIRKLCRITIQARKLDSTIIKELEGNKEYFNEIEVSNNLAILQHIKNESNIINKVDTDRKSIEILENILIKDSSVYRDYVTYNLGVIKADIKLLKECNLPEGLLQVDYLQNNTETSDENLKAFLVKENEAENIDTTEIESSEDANSITFRRILKGFRFIENHRSINTSLTNPTDFTFLDKAESLFIKESHSKYSINGLGICAVLRGNFTGAMKLFQQITGEYEDAYKNIANCHVLLKNYDKAIENYLRIHNPKVFARINKNHLDILGTHSKDLKLIDGLISIGIPLKNHKARVLIEQGRISKVNKMDITDEEIKLKLLENDKTEEERKMKIAEIEEYRKRQKNN